MRTTVLIACAWLLGACGSAPGGGGAVGGGMGGGMGGGGTGGGAGGGVPPVEPTLVFRGLSFGPGASPTADQPVIADYNGDGRLDIALGSSQGGRSTTFLGNGDGTFRDGAELLTGGATFWGAAGDINGDSKVDLVFSIPANATNDMSGLLGNGDGTFRAPQYFAAGMTPTMVVASALGGDARTDVAVINVGSREVEVFIGGQSQGARYSLGFSPAALVAADIDEDGNTDLAVGGDGSPGGSLALFHGAASGAFSPWQLFTADLAVSSVAAGDFNADGKTDLVLAAANGNIVIATGKGDGTFSGGMAVSAFPGGSSGQLLSLVVADFNGGGHLDVAALVVPTGATPTVNVLLGRGDGTLLVPNSVGSFPAMLRASSLATADLNADGKPDLVVAHGAVDVLINESQ